MLSKNRWVTQKCCPKTDEWLRNAVLKQMSVPEMMPKYRGQSQKGFPKQMRGPEMEKDGWEPHKCGSKQRAVPEMLRVQELGSKNRWGCHKQSTKTAESPIKAVQKQKLIQKQTRVPEILSKKWREPQKFCLKTSVCVTEFLARNSV